MNRLTVAPILTLALSFCTAANVSTAAAQSFAPAAPTTTTTAIGAKTMAGKIKLVSFTMRNAAGTALTLQVGDQQLTISPGKSVAVKAPAGQQIVTVSAAGRMPAGSLVSIVSSALQGNTIVVN